MTEKVKGNPGRKPFKDRGRIVQEIRVWVKTWQVEALGGREQAEEKVKEYIEQQTARQ